MEVYTPEEAAGILKLSAYTVRKLLKEGKLKGHKIGAGHQWRIKRSDLEAFLEGNANAASSGEAR